MVLIVVMEKMALQPRGVVVVEKERCARGKMMMTVVGDICSRCIFLADGVGFVFFA